MKSRAPRVPICPQKATAEQPADQPGALFAAPTFEALADGTAVFDTGATHATLTAGPTLAAALTLLGAGTITAAFTPSGDNASAQFNARLYEVLPDGSAVLADRGMRRLSAAEAAPGTISFELFGNGWRFSQGNRLRLELAQDDSPYLKSSQPPSSLALSRVTLSLPTRSPNAGGGGGGVGGGGGGSSGGGAAGPTLLLALLAGLLLPVLVRRRGA